MEVWTQTSVYLQCRSWAHSSRSWGTSYCVFCCCLTALSSANQTSTWGFSLLTIQWLLSGLIGVFLHVRCIPHQNSQRLCFWASVWFMLDSSRWHEPLGGSLSGLKIDTLKRALNWHFWISNSSKYRETAGHFSVFTLSTVVWLNSMPLCLASPFLLSEFTLLN